MEYIITKANENDKLHIARTIAYSFEKDLSKLTKDAERIANAFESGIDTSRFFVARQENKMVGIIACSDCTGRAVYVNKKDCKKHLGLIRGFLGYRIFADEFMYPLTYPATTGWIEFVGVVEEARGQGIAKAMLKKIIEHSTQYNEFILDVTDINAPAMKIYENSGFVEFDRKPVKFPKQMGFNAKVYMKYIRES